MLFPSDFELTLSSGCSEYQYTGDGQASRPGQFDWIKLDPSLSSVTPAIPAEVDTLASIDPALQGDIPIDPALSMPEQTNGALPTSLAAAESQLGNGLAFDIDQAWWGPPSTTDKGKIGSGSLEDLFVGVFREGQGKGASGAAWGLCD